MKLPIYLDYAATTPVDPRVAEKMSHYMTMSGVFANASSSHAQGVAAKDAIEHARAQVAAVIHADADEIIWTSGATESVNLALKGAAQLYQRKGKHIVTVKTEHSAVLDSCQQLEKEGFTVTYLAPENNGLLDIEKFRAALRDDTILASVMHVNNESGVVQDIHALASITAERSIVFHVDAAQSVGKVLLDVKNTPVDLVSLCAHKVYGPKGIGALYVRQKPRVRVAAQIHGGGQEQGMRSGTLPTHQIVGMGEAFQLAQNHFVEDLKRLTDLKQTFWQGLASNDRIKLNTELHQTVPHIMSLRFSHANGRELMLAMPELSVSQGSACGAKGTEPSYVLRAMGLSREEALGSLRFSFGRYTQLEEITYAIECIKKAYSHF